MFRLANISFLIGTLFHGASEIKQTRNQNSKYCTMPYYSESKNTLYSCKTNPSFKIDSLVHAATLQHQLWGICDRILYRTIKRFIGNEGDSDLYSRIIGRKRKMEFRRKKVYTNERYKIWWKEDKINSDIEWRDVVVVGSEWGER